MKIIEVKPVRGGWKVFEAPGVEPVFIGSDGRRRQSITRKRAKDSTRARSGVLKAAAEIVETIQFDDREKTL